MVGLLAVQMTAFANDEARDSSGLSLVGVAEQEGVLYASLFDSATGDYFLPSTKAPDSGYELVAVTEDQNAVVRHNGQCYLLRLGWSGSATPVADAPSQASVQAQNIARPGSDESAVPIPPPGAKLPLVFQSDQVKGMTFTDDQKAIISRLRSQFLAAIGGSVNSASLSSNPATTNTPTPTVVDATSPVTAPSPATPPQNWISAQEYNDEIFRMLFGTQAFLAYQMGLGSKP